MHTTNTDHVRGFAELAILTLRVNGISDQEILTTYTTPSHASADAAFEAAQIADTGHITAPAAAVRQAMQIILATDLLQRTDRMLPGA